MTDGGHFYDERNDTWGETKFQPQKYQKFLK